MFCLKNFFSIYQKMSSKDEEIFLKNYEISALKEETKRERERVNDVCVF